MKRNTVATAVGSSIVVVALVMSALALTGCPDKGGGATPSASGSGAAATSSAAPPTSKAGGSSGSGW